jgi:hypothetical protein
MRARAALATIGAALLAAAESRAGGRNPLASVGVLGVRVGGAAVMGGAGGAGPTVSAVVDVDSYRRRGLFAARVFGRGWFGGGQPGFDAGLDASLGAGVRLPFGKRHGPILRGAVRGAIEGNDGVWFSAYELPQGQVGWQYARGAVLAEAAFTFGLALAGRFRSGGAPAYVLGDGAAFGGYVAAQMPHLRVYFGWESFPSDDGALRTPVERFDARACVVFAPFAACADGRWLRGDAGGVAAREVAYGSLGLTLGASGER